MVTAPAPRSAAGAPVAGRAAAVTPPARGDWRRWRLPLGLITGVIVAAALIALLQPRPPASGYLDPAGSGPYGARALAGLAAARGDTVITAATPAAARAAASPGAATLVITSPEYLSRRQLAALAGAGRHLIVVEPGAAVLAALAPGVRVAGPTPTATAQPGCGLAAARLAGDADLGGTGLQLRPGWPRATRCYRVAGLPSLVQYASGGRLITVLGTGRPLSNGYLAQHGNAALGLNLLGAGSRVVWLVPARVPVPGLLPGGAPRPLASLIPAAVYLVAIQLGVAVLLAALWRARRLGPLITEPLPVVVRASETAEGHARLYAARRARGRAAAALRSAMTGRVLPALGLPLAAGPGTVTAALAARSALPAAEIAQVLYGQAPGTDAALVALAAQLSALEREVLER